MFVGSNLDEDAVLESLGADELSESPPYMMHRRFSGICTLLLVLATGTLRQHQGEECCNPSCIDLEGDDNRHHVLVVLQVSKSKTLLLAYDILLVGGKQPETRYAMTVAYK
jgi:hypothetical protein